jgi:RNA recognition motif-containing protein
VTHRFVVPIEMLFFTTSMASTSVETLESPSSVSNPSTEDNTSPTVNPIDEQYRKLFIGGLSYSTTDEKLK